MTNTWETDVKPSRDNSRGKKMEPSPCTDMSMAA